MAPKKPRCSRLVPKSEVQPDWPLLKPLLPISCLSLETILPSQVIVIRNFWTGTLCKNYVNFLKTLPLTTTGTPKKGEALRFNERFQILDQTFSNRLWLETGLRELICGQESLTDGQEKLDKLGRKDLW